MSRVVDEWFPPYSRKYDWSQWTDGKIHELTRGEDFETEPLKLVAAAYSHAERYGFLVRTSVRGDAVRLQFQAAPNQTPQQVPRNTTRPTGRPPRRPLQLHEDSCEASVRRVS